MLKTGYGYGQPSCCGMVLISDGLDCPGARHHESKQVKDKLVELAKSNTQDLTAPTYKSSRDWTDQVFNTCLLYRPHKRLNCHCSFKDWPFHFLCKSNLIFTQGDSQSHLWGVSSMFWLLPCNFSVRIWSVKTSYLEKQGCKKMHLHQCYWSEKWWKWYHLLSLE